MGYRLFHGIIHTSLREARPRRPWMMWRKWHMAFHSPKAFIITMRHLEPRKLWLESDS
jgi:hypothetical protein